MQNFLRTSALAVAVTAASYAVTVEDAEAQSYQIDCAILLCLSGGWPSSVPCVRARAEFIRRITPWPVEPPLQIWRCPMGVAFDVDPSTLTAARIYEILMDETTPTQSTPSAPMADFEFEAQHAVHRRSGGSAQRLPEDFMLQLVQSYRSSNQTADIDLSGSDFDFVRSIRVFNVERGSQRNVKSSDGDECKRRARVIKGSYGLQGGFTWQNSSVEELPDHHIGMEEYGADCPAISHRSVFVEWRDSKGKYGFEQVNY